MFILLRSASSCMLGCCAHTVWPCITQLETPCICTLPRTLPGCNSCAILLRNSEPCSLTEKKGETKEETHQIKKSTNRIQREKVASVWPRFDAVVEKQENLLKTKKFLSTGGGIGGIGMFLLGLGDRGACCTGSKIAKFKYFFLSSKRLYFHVHVCMY